MGVATISGGDRRGFSSKGSVSISHMRWNSRAPSDATSCGPWSPSTTDAAAATPLPPPPNGASPVCNHCLSNQHAFPSLLHHHLSTSPQSLHNSWWGPVSCVQNNASKRNPGKLINLITNHMSSNFLSNLITHY